MADTCPPGKAYNKYFCFSNTKPFIIFCETVNRNFTMVGFIWAGLVELIAK